MSDNQTKLEIWKEYLLNQKNSGLSVRTWCSENQISQPQFYYWKRKLSQKTSAQPKFTEICFADQQTEKHKGEIGSLFLFCNRRRTAIKALRYDANGFLLVSKVLMDDQKFSWPKIEKEVRSISKRYTVSRGALTH